MSKNFFEHFAIRSLLFQLYSTAALMQCRSAVLSFYCAIVLLLCCSASFAASFVQNADGVTVTDTTTGLMWQQGDDQVTRTWVDALAYCENLRLPDVAGGYADWRLPNIKELESITDDTIYDPNDPIAIDRNIFPDAFASDYWSSTTSAADPIPAWSVYFYYGSVYYYHKGNDFYVRCVRAGQ